MEKQTIVVLDRNSWVHVQTVQRNRTTATPTTVAPDHWLRIVATTVVLVLGSVLVLATDLWNQLLAYALL